VLEPLFNPTRKWMRPATTSDRESGCASDLLQISLVSYWQNKSIVVANQFTETTRDLFPPGDLLRADPERSLDLHKPA
jgi:hypothetical protein